MDLYPFQVEAVNKTVAFLKERGCCYNASEMGTGKSAVTISAISDICSRGIWVNPEVLIVCPAVVRMVWETEVRKWNTNVGISYTVISYDKAVKGDYRKPTFRDYYFLVLDEAHYCKNPKAARTKAVLALWSKTRHKICLSGTPFTQSIMDCHPIFSHMAPEDFTDYWEFAKKYTNIKRIPWGPKYKFEGVKNHEKLKKIIKEKFFFRYTKEAVLKDLPDKQYQMIPLSSEFAVKVDAKEQERYLELLKVSIARHTAPPKPPMAVATMAREQGLKKVPAIAEFARNLLDAEVPVVLFAYHTDVIEKLQEELKAYEPVTIQGSTTEASRKTAVDSFQAGKTNLFIGQIKAAGVGITLTRSSTVLLAEYSWSPADIQQAIDRTHRIGQKNAVTVYYFSVVGSIDEKFQEVLLIKSTAFKKVLN